MKRRHTMPGIQIRLTKLQISELDEILKGGLYPSRSELIRDAVRKFIDEYYTVKR